MATRYQLDKSREARRVAAEAKQGALNERQQAIDERLDRAKTALVAGMLSVAEACGATEHVQSKLAAPLAEYAQTIVTGLFEASIMEVGKVEYADMQAERVASRTRADMDDDRLQTHVDAFVDRIRG